MSDNPSPGQQIYEMRKARRRRYLEARHELEAENARKRAQLHRIDTREVIEELIDTLHDFSMRLVCVPASPAFDAKAIEAFAHHQNAIGQTLEDIKGLLPKGAVWPVLDHERHQQLRKEDNADAPF